MATSKEVIEAWQQAVRKASKIKGDNVLVLLDLPEKVRLGEEEVLSFNKAPKLVWRFLPGWWKRDVKFSRDFAGEFYYFPAE